MAVEELFYGEKSECGSTSQMSKMWKTTGLRDCTCKRPHVHATVPSKCEIDRNLHGVFSKEKVDSVKRALSQCQSKHCLSSFGYEFVVSNVESPRSISPLICIVHVNPGGLSNVFFIHNLSYVDVQW